MKKLDYKKELQHLYKPSSKDVSAVDIPPMNFLMIDGAGDPNKAPRFQLAIEALFSISYAIKFIIKKSEIEVDYGVMPLEGLWWSDDMSAFDRNDKDKWKWTLMIMQPEFVTGELVEIACREVSKKKDLPALDKLRFDSCFEGLAAQIMHIGLFSEEYTTIARLHSYINENGFKKRDKHHEIYLSDIRKAKPEKWRTILRQPIEKE